MIQSLKSWINNQQLPAHISINKDGEVKVDVDSPEVKYQINQFGKRSNVYKPRIMCRWDIKKEEYEQLFTWKKGAELFSPVKDRVVSFYDG